MTLAEGTRHSQVQCFWTSPEGEFLVVRDPGDLDYPQYLSRLWLCWVCGEVWARECMLDRGEVQAFEVIQVPCGCSPGEYYGVVPGSLAVNTRHALDTFNTLPKALQLREVKVLLESHYEA